MDATDTCVTRLRDNHDTKLTIAPHNLDAMPAQVAEQ
jgi:hypothetical protein